MDVLRILSSMRSSEVRAALAADAESIGLLPDPLLSGGLTWSMVKKTCPRFTKHIEVIDSLTLDTLLTAKGREPINDLWEQAFPARTKQDLSIRRSRVFDIVSLYRSHGMDDALRHIASCFRQGWDIIFVTNLLFATWVFGIDWFNKWVDLGALSSDVEHFSVVAKHVHNLAKSYGLADLDWFKYAECHNLVGYRNLPFPGFDVEAESEKLANGGQHHTYFGREWARLCDETLMVPPSVVPYMSFSDWLSSLVWTTPGASSRGRATFTTPDGEQIKIKCRKNFVADFVPMETIEREALSSRSQHNASVIKSELGKVRLAVAGDLETYLNMAWVTYLMGDAATKWLGDTSKEDLASQISRSFNMLRLCSKKFGLPYDYSSFDHQPTTDEILAIIEVFFRLAKPNVPATKMVEFESTCDRIRSGFHDSWLHWRDGDKTGKFHVTGGLMSGLRWTSMIGNAWNSVVTKLALDISTEWGFPNGAVERYIRGDDSALFTDTWQQAAAIDLAYRAIGIEASAGKFGVHRGQMEFLRVWFDVRCHGFPARAIPGLTQRKPWSSEPWTGDGVIRPQLEAIRTLRRRHAAGLVQLDKLERHLCWLWCRQHQTPMDILRTPSSSGGLGLLPFYRDLSLSVQPPLPSASTLFQVRPVGMTNTREELIRIRFQNKYPDLPVDANRVAQEQIATVLSTDNIPQLAQRARSIWNQALRTVKIIRSGSRLTESSPTPSNVWDWTTPDRFDSIRTRLQLSAVGWASCPEITEARADYDAIRPDLTFKTWLRRYYPRVVSSLRRFSSSTHLSDALDWLVGEVAVPWRTLHPSLSSLGSLTAAASLGCQRTLSHNAVSIHAQLLEKQLCNSNLSQLLFMF